MKVLLNLTGEGPNWLQQSRETEGVIKAILDTQVAVNQLYLRLHKVPALYHAGIRYREEPLNVLRLGGHSTADSVEEFANVPAVIERGWGDGDDIVPWRCAELREHGELAKIRLEPHGNKCHVVLRRGDGTKEDPCAKLGMTDLPAPLQRTAGKFLLNLTGESRNWLAHSRELAPVIKMILETQVAINQLYIRLHKVPPIYRSGIRYREEPMNLLRLGRQRPEAVEEFACIPAIIERGWDDCDGIGPWRCAELRHHGEKAKIRLTWRRHPQTGQKIFHVVVRRGNGDVEDPCAKLGMPTGSVERQLGL